MRRWLEEYDVRPGFYDFIFQKLKEKISHIPMKERVCALKWDEMAIKSYEEYSFLDEIEGLVDLGSLRRKSERAKCVFVFCLDSLNARHVWQQPLAYFLPGKCMKAEKIIILLKECLDRLSEMGADVQLVTCDQGTCNQSAYAQLGINPENPLFI
ncbi:transposable element p transposase [Lasius niger]|uniref:Transposable element p transposase n=1 Tax=Lasius niger TaxID=67767 RepID=A0A0J7K6L2_LASNI|nr:transposable element p transposase [Lasius niger]